MACHSVRYLDLKGMHNLRRHHQRQLKTSPCFPVSISTEEDTGVFLEDEYLDVRPIAQLGILPRVFNGGQRVLELTLVVAHPGGDLVRICEVRIVHHNL
jgi:hypothetical protein